MSDESTEFGAGLPSPEAQAAIQKMISETTDAGPKPVIPRPRDGFVTLLAGVSVGDTKIREVEVLELNGESEERLAKASTSDDRMRFYNTLLSEGVPDTIDGSPASEVLQKMLVGDREALLLGIRSATYGPEIEVRTFCPDCRDEFDAEILTSDIPVREFSGDTVFEVPLRNGGKAKVRLPNGGDQTAYMETGNLNDAERNSILLSRCVLSLPMNGEDTAVAGFPSLVRGLGIVDRRNILAEIDKRQPGPRYNEVTVKHEDCGGEVPVLLGMMSLFPGL